MESTKQWNKNEKWDNIYIWNIGNKFVLRNKHFVIIEHGHFIIILLWFSPGSFLGGGDKKTDRMIGSPPDLLPARRRRRRGKNGQKVRPEGNWI